MTPDLSYSNQNTYAAAAGYGTDNVTPTKSFVADVAPQMMIPLTTNNDYSWKTTAHMPQHISSSSSASSLAYSAY